jgi:hypothetical protein
MDGLIVAILSSCFGPPKIGHARLADGCRLGACFPVVATAGRERCVR